MTRSQAKSENARFISRDRCISCKSGDLTTLDSGRFCEEPVRSFLEQDPWGVSPLPYLEGQTWEYLRCNGCGQMFHRRVLAPEWQEVRFREWMSEAAIREFERTKGLDAPAKRFEKGVRFTEHVLRIEWMTRPIRGSAAVRVLDFGCGWGEFLTLSKLLGFEAYGIERAPDRQRYLANQGITVFPDLSAAAVAVGRSYHAATLFQVLEHLEEPLELLHALHEVMTPGGILVIEVPNCEGIEGFRDESDYYNIHPLEHINCFTPLSLRGLANRAGFKDASPAVAHVTTDPLSVVKGEAKRWVQRLTTPSTNQYFRRA